MKRLLTCGALFLVLAVSAVADPSGPDETRADFEAMALVLPYLALDPVLHGPAEEHAGPNFSEETETADGILSRAADDTYRKEDLAKLLAHDDPKVRTLAAIALFERNDPSVLPVLVPLCSDPSPTFDGCGPHVPSLDNRKLDVPARGQTVGSVVSAMVDAYLRSAGYTHGVQPKPGPGFEEYWAARRERTDCAGWFAVQLDRAGHGVVPTPETCIGAIRAVRRRIDAAPAAERATVLLWLRGQPGSDALATDDEILRAVRVLGRGRLLGLLREHGPTDDPDVQPGGSNDWMFRRMQRFVLERAVDFFGSDDTDDLLACGRQTIHAEIAAGCAVAAARLRPRDAGAILHAAMDSVHDQRQCTLLAAELCRMCGPAERASALEWFYQAATDRGIGLDRASFVDRVSAGAHGREMLAAIVRDYRLGSIDQETLRRVARAVGTWNAAPVVAEEEFQQPTWKTNDLKPEWVRKLRESVPRWIDEPAQEGKR